MQLFSRIATPTGSPRRVMAWATEMTAFVNANSDLEVSCWAGQFGFPLGTIGWSTIVENQVALAAGQAQLYANDGYFDLIEQAADMAGEPGQDTLRNLVHGSPAGPPPLGAVATTSTAVAVVDRFAEAVMWGIEVAQLGESITGHPIAVLTDAYGTMGSMAWIAVADDLATSEAAGTKLRASGDYLAKLQGSKGLFIPGSGHVSQVTRFA